MKNITASILLLALVGCGGSSEGDSVSSPVADNSGTVTDSGNEFNPGGTPSNPGQVSFVKKNEINVDTFENYFTLNLEKDSKVYISALLDLGLEVLEQTRCESAGTTRTSFITADGVNVACDFRARFDLSAGEHEIHFNYPDENYGYFTIDTVANNEREILDENGSGGLPSAPRRMSLTQNNDINVDLNNNYYAFEGKAGDKLFINTYLEEFIPQIIFTRCQSGGRAEKMGRASIGISINDGPYSCTKDLEFELPEDGVYVLNLSYMSSDIAFPVKGYFRADVQYAQ